MATNCTKHSLQRWVERVVGIETKVERDAYVTQMQEQLKEDMNRTFEYATFIYKGQIGDNITRNYYIKDEIIIVTDTINSAIITVYKIDFGFTSDLNLVVSKRLVEEIHKLTAEKEEVEFQQELQREELENQFSKLAEEEEILKKQLKLISEKKVSVNNSAKELSKAVEFADLEIKKYTNQLINSKDYREDIKEGVGK